MSNTVSSSSSNWRNTGIFSVIAALANPRAHVHAFEIVPDVFEVLFRNVIRNDVGPQVTCHFAGIDRDGFTMRVPPASDYSSLPLSYSAAIQAQEGPRVPFVSLDTFCASMAGGTQLLVKIDVEATEAALFANGWSAVKRLRPWIICEILAGAAGTSELGESLTRMGYHLFKITDQGLHEAPRLMADARHHDWLFAPSDASGLNGRVRIQPM